MHIDQTGIQEEQSFVKALRSKDVKAYNILYNHYAAALNGIISRIISDKKQCEKILSELLTDIWSDIDSYNPQNQRLFSWMVRKARLRAANSNYKYDLTDVNKTKVKPTHVFNTSERKEGLKEIGTATVITDKEMEIFDLIYYKGMSAQKVANSYAIKMEELRPIIRKVIKKAGKTFKVN